MLSKPISNRSWLCICVTAITFFILWRATFLWLNSALRWVSYGQVCPIVCLLTPRISNTLQSSGAKSFTVEFPKCNLLLTLHDLHMERMVSSCSVMTAQHTKPSRHVSRVQRHTDGAHLVLTTWRIGSWFFWCFLTRSGLMLLQGERFTVTVRPAAEI